MAVFSKYYFLFGLLLTTIISNQIFAFDHILKLNSEINFSPPSTDWATFIVSSEMSLNDAKPILQQAPSGLFMSVGTERAFQGASLTDKATHVLLFDYDTKIVRFNRINIELLKAKTLAHYRILRWDADFSAWQDFINNNKRYNVSLSQEDYDWWVANARDITAVGNIRMEYINRYGKDVYYDNFIKIYGVLSLYAKSANTSVKDLCYPKSFSDWHEAGLELSEQDWQWWDRFILRPDFWTDTDGKNWLEKPSVAFDILSVKDLKSGNYLFDKKLYQKLHLLALNKRMAVCQLDIRNKEHISKLVLAVSASKIKISVADLDNIYMTGYVGLSSAYDDMVKDLLPLGTNRSVLLAMAPATSFESYLGFTFENIKHWPQEFSIQRLVADIYGEIAALLQGRLYSGRDLPRWSKIDIK